MVLRNKSKNGKYWDKMQNRTLPEFNHPKDAKQENSNDMPHVQLPYDARRRK